EAIHHPRLHVELADAGPRVAHEPGIPASALPFPTRPLDAPSMFFGGVTAAAWSREAGFDLGADPRRDAGVALGGEPA
ncbi:MAG: gamma-glutamyltransferase, partial [Gemmatimonadota bacterium]|nr:gamma-glutamyltransferase [Gemmatimonadota bacterium]